jgi:hypothetical protein
MKLFFFYFFCMRFLFFYFQNDRENNIIINFLEYLMRLYLIITKESKITKTLNIQKMQRETNK